MGRAEWKKGAPSSGEMSGRAGRHMDRERLMQLFDANGVAPGTNEPPMVGGAGGGLAETHAAGAVGYFAGGYGTLAEQRDLMAAGGPSGYLLAGGARRSRRRRRQRGGKRKTGRREPALRLNLRAQIRLRSRSQRRH